MNHSASPSDDLRDWTLIGLRAADQQAPLRRTARRHGAAFLSLPALRLLPAEDGDAARAALQRALDCPVCLFTSPAAVRFAAGLRDLRGFSGTALALGSGTANALRRAGVAEVRTPASGMRSEDVLALPPLHPPPAQVGLVTAPGGRGVLAATLAQRGAQVRVAEVYRRLPAALSARARHGLRQLRQPAALLLSSGEALQHLLAQLDAEESTRLRSAWAISASPRLDALATRLGFTRRIAAASTLPADQIAALRAALRQPSFPKSAPFR